MVLEDLTVVVCCNKNDAFFARICIASIRYYYPNIDIEIVKDLGNGNFNTKELEKYFNVKNVNLNKDKMGWGGGKFHYFYSMIKLQKVLVIDADIVFIGNFIERLLSSVAQNEFVVSVEIEDNPYAKWVKEIYFDTKKVETFDKLYKFPGYFFNTGQMFITGGSIDIKILDNFFDVKKPPYFRNLELFPLVDQSLYNYLLPTLVNQNKLKLGIENFMLWSKSDLVKKISLSDIIEKRLDIGLIHWAGDIRTDSLIGMSRHDILYFFEQYYYSIIPFGKIKFIGLRIPIILIHFLKYIYRNCKKNIKDLFRKFIMTPKIKIA